jgi:hypothetical protein
VVQYPDNFSNPYECLKGFEPFSMNYSRLNDWSGGCVRKSPLQCENKTHANVKKDWFMKISNMRLPVHSKTYLAMNASRCELACMENCSCVAYAYNRSGCMIWEETLVNLQKLPYGGEIGQDILVKIDTRKLSRVLDLSEEIYWHNSSHKTGSIRENCQFFYKYAQDIVHRQCEIIPQY